MEHDSERMAAAYLSGTMPRRRRKGFQEHILTCQECWSEVELGRRGRSLAEQGRELAPPEMRERLRMLVEATPSPQRRWQPVGIAAAAVVASLIALLTIFDVTVREPEQPMEIALLVADFESAVPLKTPTENRLPRRLGDLRLQDSRTGYVGELKVTAHEYVDTAGHEVVVYQADRSFPEAAGAVPAPEGETWTATVDGAVLFCADRPVPSLVVGDDEKEVALAANELGLR